MNTTLRLTRRGRVVVVMLLAALMCTAFAMGRIGSSQAATDRVQPYGQTTVKSGETLWSVAKRVAPGRDPRAVVEQIRSLNHLASGSVQAGQQLLLPRAS